MEDLSVLFLFIIDIIRGFNYDKTLFKFDWGKDK